MNYISNGMSETCLTVSTVGNLDSIISNLFLTVNPGRRGSTAISDNVNDWMGTVHYCNYGTNFHRKWDARYSRIFLYILFETCDTLCEEGCIRVYRNPATYESIGPGPYILVTDV